MAKTVCVYNELVSDLVLLVEYAGFLKEEPLRMLHAKMWEWRAFRKECYVKNRSEDGYDPVGPEEYEEFFRRHAGEVIALEGQRKNVGQGHEALGQVGEVPEGGAAQVQANGLGDGGGEEERALGLQGTGAEDG